MAEKIWTPKSKEDLEKLINANIPLSSIDTSLISDMSELFKDSKRTDFSGIEGWNTSNVTTMKDMFMNAIHFNSDISAWDTSKVVNMQGMFAGAESFNQPLNSWDTSSVRDMACMFFGALSFNQPLDKWITVFVENMGGMFSCAESFNQNINDWNVSNVINMGKYELYYLDKDSGQYRKAYNGKYDGYYLLDNGMGLELGANDGGMFSDAKSFNQPLDKWNVSSVVSMWYMFCDAKAFNQNLDSWSVDSLKCIDYCFEGSAMENNLPKWCKE